MNSKPSKSAKKRDAQAIDALATRLLRLSEEQLAAVPLDDQLRDTIAKTRKMTARSALRRQRLYFARLLREKGTAAIERACDELDRADNEVQRLFHQTERWRDRLVQERGTALLEFSRLTGRQSARLAQLVSDLDRDLPENRQRRLAREIFREIHAELATGVQDDASSI